MSNKLKIMKKSKKLYMRAKMLEEKPRTWQNKHNLLGQFNSQLYRNLQKTKPFEKNKNIV